MGALYLAVTGDKGLERLLCIKTVLPHLADKEYVARFRDEAKIVVQLSHGNLIPVFDAGQVAGELFLAMEFVKGKDLRAVWNRCAKKGVAFPIDVAVYVTKELCRGLGYAHGFGDINLVHRDVSPPNVLLSYAGEVKLTDFGLASSTLKMEKTLPGIIYGKVAYMSPEQARGEKLDGRSDVYAAGIILWELLTGRQLFPPGKEQPQDLLKRARDPDVEAPSIRAPRVPTDLDSIVLKALGSDPNNRYTKAEEFRDALGVWLAANSPATDANRLENFIGDLFDNDMKEEEEARVTLMETTRDRVRTLPPTDELRRLLEASGGMDGLAKKVDRRQVPGEDGDNKRRAIDNGDDEQDRRGGGGRRIVDVVDRTKRGVAVDVSPPRADGSTVIGTSNPATAPTQMGLATAAAAQVDESTAPDDVLGQVLDDRYRVSSLLGEGGMGRVYLAEHVDIGKLVAVKILHPVYSRMPDLVERFRREARAASKIGHPNIVDVTDSGTTHDGSVYFVMEYLEGVELAGIIDREGAIDIRRALGISTQICRALSAAHAAGIIHRDLKPENVFLTSREGTSDFVKVLDFGIAKSSEAEEARNKKLTHPGMAMGTPEYMAPEQAAGKHADERCDVYAVGAILYEMLTGTPPYDGENFMEILTKKATVEPIPPRQLRAEIPEIVETLLMQAMAREPDNRPPSMEAFEYELTKCFAGRSVAVANILGISQDGDFQGGNQEVARRASSEFGAEGTGLMSQMGGGRPNTEFPPEAENTEAIPDMRGGGRRAFGWVVLLGLVVGAGAIVLYVAKGEKKAASSTPALVEKLEAAPVVEEKPTKEKSRPGKVGVKRERGKEKPEPSANNNHKRDSGATKEHASKKPHIKKPHSGPPRNKKEAERLLREAKGFAADMNWAEARVRYRWLVSGKFLQQSGYLGLADIAFQEKNGSLAISYAKKAGSGRKARMLLGNGYFQNQDYKAALKIYEEILKKSPEHREAQSHAKEARKRLGRK